MILKRVQVFDLELEFLSCDLVTGRIVFSVDDMVANFPHFEPVFPYGAYDLDGPSLAC